MNKCEILAPVGNEEMLKAAVRCGADAVYLGAKDFNARRNAENFGELDLADAVKYCHTFSVKVYLTLNISIKDDEVEKATDLAVFAHKCGIDGIIITDLGLCEILKTVCPNLPLHASTQMTVHSISALPVLQKLGIKRVVLSREMSREQIREFTEKAQKYGIETEVFVHGALCMSMSGQCLLSAVLGGRSGNRGLCAGPCRLPFKAENGSDYALSLKDLSLLENIGELSEMGVASVKIEGRMKRPEYVAAAVTAAKKSRDNENFFEDFARLQAVFSRSGFTKGYFENKTGSNMFGIRTKEDVLSANDTFSYLHELYRAERQTIGATAKITVKKDLPITLTLSAEDFSATVCGEIPQAAKNKPLETQDLEKSISKLGSTPYFLEKTEAELDENLFVSASALNSLRNEAVKKLTEMRLARPVPEIFQRNEKCEKRKTEETKIFCRFEDNSQIPQSLDNIDGVLIPLENEPPRLPENIIKIAELPRGVKSEAAILNRLKIFKKKGFTYAAAGNLAEIELINKAEMKLFSAFSMNVYNSYSAEFLSRLGADYVNLSPELTLSAAKKVSSPACTGIFAYGRLPLMLTANCPVSNNDCEKCDKKRFLTDRMGVKFPVRCRMGFAELLNSTPIFLADKSPEISDFDFLTLYFTDETPEIAEKIISAYSCASDYKPENFTRGLYYKGVM